MASILNADTSNGLKITSDTSGEIKLQSAGTDIVSVTANGMAVDTSTLYVNASTNTVGVNTTNPIAPVHAVQSGQGSIAYFNNINASWAGDVQVAYSPSGSTVSTLGFSARSDGSTWLTSNYGNMVFITGTSGSGSERMRISSNGNLLFGTTTAGTTLATGFNVTYAGGSTYSAWGHVNGTGAGQPWCVFSYNSTAIGSIVQIGTTGTQFNTSSDYRLKENVTPMSGSIDRLKQLKPSTWSWVQDGSHGEGFLAHEAQEVVPEAVSGTKDAMKTEEYEITPAVLNDMGDVVTEAVMGTREVPDYQGIDQSKLVPLLTAALQEAITKIEDLETRIQALENA